MGFLKSLNKRWQLFHLQWQVFRLRRQSPTKRIISFWERDGVNFNYYEIAENEKWTNPFWTEGSLFYTLFQQLQPNEILEIACGSGRHAARIINRVNHLWLLDTSKGALELAKERFRDFTNITYLHSDDGMGIRQSMLADESVTAVFSYDAMVHFEPDCVKQYLVDSYRVLKPGGKALFHHSNYTKNKGGSFHHNPGWRNYMSQDLFAAYAQEAGFNVAASHVLTWAEPDSDCLTLLQKPV
jgi:SAM-dependent methyltransferase